MTPVLLASTHEGGALDPQSHVQRHEVLGIEGLSNHMLMAGVGTLLALVILGYAASRIATKPEKGAEGYVTRGAIPGLVETVLVYLRDEMARPLLGKVTDRYIPFIWSAFAFILIGNILGMIPFGAFLGLAHKDLAHLGGTFTGNISFTATLALIAILVTFIAGVREGGLHYFAHYWTVPLKGQPVLLWPLLVIVGVVIAVIEIVGNFAIKPFALAMRLFANMLAGHILLGTIIIVGVTAIQAASPAGYVGAGVSFVGALAISFMELFVAFLQAFIFAFLTTIFISLGLPHHEEHEEGHADAH